MDVDFEISADFAMRNLNGKARVILAHWKIFLVIEEYNYLSFCNLTAYI